MAKKRKDRYKIISEELKTYKQMLKDPRYKDKKQLKGMIEAREHQLKIFRREASYEQTKKSKKKMTNKKDYIRNKTKKKFLLDGKKVNFTYQGMAHGEKSKKARKKGIERSNYYGRFEKEGSSYHVFIRKKK